MEDFTHADFSTTLLTAVSAQIYTLRGLSTLLCTDEGRAWVGDCVV